MESLTGCEGFRHESLEKDTCKKKKGQRKDPRTGMCLARVKSSKEPVRLEE